MHGYGFPTRSSVTKADRGRYQRVKIVGRGFSCSSAVPSAVSGIDCANFRRVFPAEPRQVEPSAGTLGAHRTAEHPAHTVCSTRPTSWTSDQVTWSGIEITAGSMEHNYDVCYCDGLECSQPGSWVRVPPLASSSLAGALENA